MDTPRVKTRHSGRAGIHPKIRGCSFGTHCVHTCAHLYTRNTPRNCTLINSSFGTRWNPYFRPPPIRDALEYTQNGGGVSKHANSGRHQIHPKTPEYTIPPIRDAMSGRTAHTITHNHTQTHTTTHKKIFFHKNSHEHTRFHTHTHTECVSTLHSRAVPHRPSHTNIYIYIYIYSQRHRKIPLTSSQHSLLSTTPRTPPNTSSSHKKNFHRATQKIFFHKIFTNKKNFPQKTPKTLDFRRNSQKFINIQKHAYSHVLQKTPKITIFRTPQNTPKNTPFFGPPRTPQNRKTPRFQISPNFTQFCTKCAHLYTPNFTNSPLFTDPESSRTSWIHPASKPVIRDALEYTPKGGVCQNTRIRDATKSPQNTRIYNPAHSGRHVGTHCTHNHTQSHTNSHNYTQKNIFPQKFTRTHNIPHTYIHRVRQHSTFSGGTTQAITYKYIYIHIYIASAIEKIPS